MRCFAALAFVFLSFQLGTTVARRPIHIRRESGPTPTSTTTAFNPGLESLVRIDRTPQVQKRYITNAERLASGLPLNPPVRRKKKDRVVARGKHAPRHQEPHQPHHPHPSSSPSKVQSGFIQIFDASSGDIIGVIDQAYNPFGESVLTTDFGQALSVQIDVGLASTGATNMVTTNGPDVNFPYFGAITGFSFDFTNPNLGLGNPNYLYLGGVTETSQGSRPIESPSTFSSSLEKNALGLSAIESAIWSIDSGNTLSCHWVNQDSSTHQLFAGLVDGSLIYTGDTNAFQNTHGQSMQNVTFQFVPTSNS